MNKKFYILENLVEKDFHFELVTNVKSGVNSIDYVFKFFANTFKPVAFDPFIIRKSSLSKIFANQFFFSMIKI